MKNISKKKYRIWPTLLKQFLFAIVFIIGFFIIINVLDYFDISQNIRLALVLGIVIILMNNDISKIMNRVFNLEMALGFIDKKQGNLDVMSYYDFDSMNVKELTVGKNRCL